MEGKEEYMERQKFYEQYHKDHYCCPKCHCKNYSTTLAGYILVPGKEDEYKNKNSVECISCGWKGIYHDLAPKPEKTGFKIGVVDFGDKKEEFSEYDGKIYSEEKAKSLVEQLDKAVKDRNKMYYAFEVEVK